MRCRNCGANINNGDSYCRKCGMKVEEPIVVKSKSNKTVIISVAIIGILSAITIIMATYIINTKKSNENSSAIITQNDIDVNSSNEVNNQATYEQGNNSNSRNSKDNTNSSYVSKNIIGNYSNNELRELNVFLSNFSEVNFRNFSNKSIHREQLIEFAILHLMANDYQNSVKSAHDSNGGYYEYITDDSVQGSINKYFHFTVKNQSTYYYKYENGVYILPNADGEMFPNFTQVKEIYKEGDSLRVIGDVYCPNVFDDMSNNNWRYDPMDRVSNFNENIKYLGNVEAIVKLEQHNGKLKYKLVEYKVNY
ncbi:hypothetical protein [Terrisporobacter sp.]